MRNTSPSSPISNTKENVRHCALPYFVYSSIFSASDYLKSLVPFTPLIIHFFSWNLNEYISYNLIGFSFSFVFPQEVLIKHLRKSRSCNCTDFPLVRFFQRGFPGMKTWKKITKTNCCKICVRHDSLTKIQSFRSLCARGFL